MAKRTLDETLVDRVRHALDARDDVEEKRMFGGVCFMVAGKMACGVSGADLMVRVAPDGYDRALSRAHARPMDFTGRPLKNFLFVGPEGVRTSASLRKWVDESVAFATSLAAKPARKRR